VGCTGIRGFCVGRTLERARIEKKLDSLNRPMAVGVKEKGLFDGMNEWIEKLNEKFGKKKEEGD